MRQTLTRRKILAAGAAGLTGTMLSSSLSAADSLKPVQVRVNPDHVLGQTPRDFLGFGYEISSVAVKGLLSDSNRTLVQFYRTLGTEGVVRIGGNTSDFSTWAPDGEAVSAPKATVTNRAVIDDLGRFVHATGWKLIWGLNLGSGTVESAVDQAVAVAAAAKDRLLCFQIGNEPDLFSRSDHRPAGYGYAEYIQDFRRFAAELRKGLPGVALGGPDVAGSTDWVASFAQDGGSNIKLLTEHYYRAGQKQPAATFKNLLHTDPRFVKMTDQLREDSHRFGIPYRLVELNSFSGGGKLGVSDTFTSALWALDLLFTLAFADGAGINLETGVNQLGFISPYSPIFDDEHGRFTARPSYYAMLAFALAGRGKRLETSLDASGVNMTAYSVVNDEGQTWLTLINKDVSSGAHVKIACPQGSRSAEVMRLTAPAFDSKTDVTLAGSEVSGDGQWKAKRSDRLKQSGGSVKIELPTASAAFIRFS
ncbi:MAG: glycosyl hydrolase family 79 C-terminal domain-containing protein [Acidobacteriota bacterium]|nr:glycosyl hydrolase family 79 C-terminal domain-containing protein [Acidobacteriota bacterium]